MSPADHDPAHASSHDVETCTWLGTFAAAQVYRLQPAQRASAQPATAWQRPHDEVSDLALLNFFGSGAGAAFASAA